MHWTVDSHMQQTGHHWLGDGDRHVGTYASPDDWRTCSFYDIDHISYHVYIT